MRCAKTVHTYSHFEKLRRFIWLWSFDACWFGSEHVSLTCVKLFSLRYTCLDRMVLTRLWRWPVRVLVFLVCGSCSWCTWSERVHRAQSSIGRSNQAPSSRSYLVSNICPPSYIALSSMRLHSSSSPTNRRAQVRCRWWRCWRWWFCMHQASEL